MLLLFFFGVQLLATEKNVWSTISYNPPIIVYWQVTALEKDLCLLVPVCLANDSSAYNCNERQWKQYQSTNEVTLPSQRHHSWALGKVLLTKNHLPDLYITTLNNQNNNKPLIVLVWTLWSSGFLKFSEWLTKSQWYHEMSTFMSLYNVQKQHNLALENVRKNSTHLSKSSSPVEPSSVWKGTEWPIIAQNLKSICFQAFLGAILTHVQGVPVKPHIQRVQNMYGKGG